MGDLTYLNLTKSIKFTKSYKITKTTTAHLSNYYYNSVVKYCIAALQTLLNIKFNSIQFKFICIALFTIQSLQSALQEIKFLQYIYTL